MSSIQQERNKKITIKILVELEKLAETLPPCGRKAEIRERINRFRCEQDEEYTSLFSVPTQRVQLTPEQSERRKRVRRKKEGKVIEREGGHSSLDPVRSLPDRRSEESKTVQTLLLITEQLEHFGKRLNKLELEKDLLLASTQALKTEIEKGD